MTALVTGATAGFGEAICRRLIREGYNVVGVGRRRAKLDLLRSELGHSFLGVPLDIQNKTAVQNAISGLPQKFQEIDILVNNAGLALGVEPAQKANIENWEQMVNTNINGLLYCIHAVLPQMVARNRGHIVNMGSIAAEYAYPGGNVYGGTKAFVRQLSLNLRSDLLGTAVRVTDIEPGMVGGTEFSTVRFKGGIERAKNLYKDADALTAEDIAEAVFWTVSLPARMNVNVMSIMPVCQASGPLLIDRKPR